MPLSKKESLRPIAVDAMGGDLAPVSVIRGIIDATHQGLGPVLLYGNRKQLEPLIQGLGGLPPTVELRDSGPVIEMADPATWAARTKQGSSIHLGISAVQSGEARAFFSAGNSAAVVTIASLTLKRLEGCARPAIVGFMPSVREPVVLVDMGANTKVKSLSLAQFAVLGDCFARVALGKENPRLGLLSNGAEESKGTDTLRRANELLRGLDLNYIGYVEANVLPKGSCEVVICDGFVGNVVLKLSEGIIEALAQRLRELTGESFQSRLGLGLLQGQLRTEAARLDWRGIGGAPLLGLDGLCVLSHGSADAEAITA
ncbi:MAG: phosphate acyltransferase PlsX, partial [Myxococcota bacterium]|nr:phosphate acyltransferase PlsX [Myxococcota bacterium]